MSCVTAKHERGESVPHLIRCSGSTCSQLWQDTPRSANAVYPKQVTIDIDNCGVSGVVARYEKSVSVDAIKSSIDLRYSKSAYAGNSTTPVKMWRVESEKFAIGLAVEDTGMKQITYLTFQPNARVFEDWVNSGAFGGAGHDQAGTTTARSEEGAKAPCAEK
jgi:hypothetical protein